MSHLLCDWGQSPGGCRTHRFGVLPNASIVRDLPALENFINIRVAKVTEDFVNGIKQQAQRCFFVVGEAYEGR